jgi:hypothetical protein
MSMANDIFESLQSPCAIVLHGLQAAISRQRLAPLIRCIELAMSALRTEQHEGMTIFSCDSFCPQHLETQLALFEALNRISQGTTNFLNVPVAHQVTSTPDISILRNIRKAERLLWANDEMIRRQEKFLGTVPASKRILLSHEHAMTVSAAFDRLTQTVPTSEWKELIINKFPFHELSLRDLSLTYKCTPGLCEDAKSPYHEHYILSNQFNIWLLIQLILSSRNIGAIGLAMSFYTATTVFRFFCRQTKRISRFFNPSSLTTIDVGMNHDNLVCLLESPVSLCGLTSASNSLLLESINMKSQLSASFDEYLLSRIKGYVAHAYSPPEDPGSEAESEVQDWISSQRQQGKVICSAFTSSLDETIGQKLTCAHENLDLSHLQESIFVDQDEWLRCLISFFRDLEASACLIIRIHPRLARDKRGLLESPALDRHITEIINAIGECKSIKLVYPDSDISSYKLGIESDLILNGWSTIGLEFAMMGKLVCNAFYKCAHGGAAFYPVHLQSTPIKTAGDYKARVIRLVQNHQTTSSTSDEVIRAEEARKAFISAYLCGLININDDASLRSQLAKPVLLTPLLCRILAEDHESD